MFVVPSSTDVFSGISTYAGGAWTNFYPLIALIVGLFAGVAVVLIVIALLKRGVGALRKTAHGRRGR